MSSRVCTGWCIRWPQLRWSRDEKTSQMKRILVVGVHALGDNDVVAGALSTINVCCCCCLSLTCNTPFHGCCMLLQQLMSITILTTTSHVTNMPYRHARPCRFSVHSYTQPLTVKGLVANPSGNHRANSRLADSTESEPWIILRPTSMQKSPRMVPGADARGLVAPMMERPVATTYVCWWLCLWLCW